jgi:hypothetical protein
MDAFEQVVSEILWMERQMYKARKYRADVVNPVDVFACFARLDFAIFVSSLPSGSFMA